MDSATGDEPLRPSRRRTLFGAGWTVAAAATVVVAAVLGLTACETMTPSPREAIHLATSPTPTVTAARLTRAQQVAAGHQLRQRPLPTGFDHADRNCARIGDLAPNFAKYVACYRTLATITKVNPDAAAVGELMSPLSLSLSATTTTCGPMGDGYGNAIECTAVGAIDRVPVFVSVLLGSPSSATDRWTYIKLEVEPSTDLQCAPGANTCLVGAP